MAGLEELKQAILRSKQAAGSLSGLDEQYARADALRDRPMPQINEYGTVSPFSVLANVVDRSRGRRDVRELTPQRQAAMQDIASGEAMLEGDVLRRALAKEGREVESHADDLTMSKFERTLKKQQEERARLKQQHELSESEGEGETWINKDGERLAVVYDNLNRPRLLNGQEVPEGYYPEGYRGSGLGTRGKAFSDSDKRRIQREISAVEETRRVTKNYKPMYAQPTGLPTAFINNFASASSRNDLLKYVGPDVDPDVKEAAQWWADWRFFFTLEKRHELFGATLTANEQKAWDEAQLVMPGMDPAEVKRRIETLQAAAERALLKRANMGMADTLPQNQEVWRRGIGDLYAYDPEKSIFLMPEEEPEVVIEPSQAQSLIDSFDAQTREAFDTLSPEEQDGVIRRLLSE